MNDRKPGPGEKEEMLRARLGAMEKVVVAFSGGVDSSYLSLVASRELGPGALCITGLSASVAAEHRVRARSVAAAVGLIHLEIETEELADPDYVRNDARRCYFCKNELYGRLRAIAEAEGISFIIDGTNADDLGDHRPGREAAEKWGVGSPLADIGFTKEDIREMSRRHGLETWDIPASPCLASRIQYGQPVTIGRLRRVEEGESFLRSLGFREFRVRTHGDLARLEFAQDEMERALQLDKQGAFVSPLRQVGFSRVEVDPTGFRSGSMNEALNREDRRRAG